MANKVATKQVRFRVTTNITVPAGTVLPNSITLKSAFQNGLRNYLEFEKVKIGELRYEQLVPPSSAGKAKGKPKQKSKPKPKPKSPKSNLQPAPPGVVPLVFSENSHA